MMKNIIIKKLTHQNLEKDSWDKTILLLAFILGIVGNIVLKLLPISIIIPALFSALVIIGYVVWTYRSEGARLEPEQIGDNAYYLGFILTLSSLSYTLYSISSSRGEADFISGVISGFGIALSSTIVGVAMRVYMQQFRLDLVARDQEARLAINQAMREFRTELNDSVRGMKLFGVEMRQSLDEHHDKLSEAQEERLNHSLKEMLNSFDSVVVEFTKQSQKSHAEIIDHAKKTLNFFYEDSSNVLGKLEESLSDTGEKVESSMLSIGSSIIDQVEINKVNFSKISDSIRSSNESVVAAISEFDSTVNGAFQNINGNVGFTVNKVEEASSLLTESSSKIDIAVNSALESMSSIVKMNNQELMSASDLLAKKAKNDEQVTSQLNHAIRELTSEVAKFSSDYHSQHSSVESIANDFKILAVSFNNEIIAIREGQQDLLSKIEKIKHTEVASRYEVDSEAKHEDLTDNHSGQPFQIYSKEDNPGPDDSGKYVYEGGKTIPSNKKTVKSLQYLFGGGQKK